MARTTSRILLVLLALALPGLGLAQCQLAELLKIPVTLNGEKPLLPAKVNGADAEFVLDSGAFFNSISRSAARRFNLHMRPLPFGFDTYGVGGRTDDAEWTTVDEIAIGGVRIHNVDFIVGDDLFGDRVAGFIGQNVLSGFDIDYDLAKGVIRLMYPDKACRDSVLAYWAGSTPFSVIDLSAGEQSFTVTGSSRAGHRGATHTLGYVHVNGKRVQAMFDTGAGDSMIDTEAARSAGVTRDSPGVKPGGMVGGFGPGRVESWIAPFDTFQIGDEKISHTRLRVGDLRHLGAEMLIGADFFLSHRVYVSNLQHKLYFTYNGGPVFDLSHARNAPPPGDGEALADADDYSRRGLASAARGNVAAAIADLTRACELAPSDARYFLQRADVRQRAGDADGAKADLDLALTIKPDAQDVRLKRAALQIGRGQVDAALADLAAAAGAVAADSSDRLRIAQLYLDAGRPSQAVDQYDRWIETHPDEPRRASAFNGRCWSHALSGQDLDAGLKDCNQALKLDPDASEYLDSRGLVRLRQQDYDGAIADYDRALRQGPDQAWSLYGRGLAKLKKGRTAEGQADLDAAKAADPKIAEEAARYGIAP